MNRCPLHLVVVGLLVAGCASGPPDARVDDARHDFGAVGQQARLEHDFRIYNAGGEPLLLQEVEDACSCTVSEILTPEVPPKREGRVRTVFSTAWYHGELAKSVYVTTNDPDQPQLQLVVAATVAVDLEVEPRIHYLGEVVPGETLSVATVLTNRTDGPVSVTGLELPGPDVRAVDLPAETISPEQPLELAAGQSLTLAIEAVPQPGQGAYSRKIVVQTAGTRPQAFPVLLVGRYVAE